MANYLILNQSQVFNGLGTLTYTVPTTGQYNVSVQVTVPEAVATGSFAGSNQGLGSGTGGGGEGFTGGDLGTGHGGVGQGFGAGNGYQQPSSQGSNQTSGSAVSSGVSILVKKNGSTIFTAPAFVAGQSALQFKYGFLATAADSITVVIASSTGSDNGLNGVTSNVSISQGLN
jgi:poly(3-hydroxybutyrate) depolymerase